MKSLETLIKISQQQLDEYRHNLNILLDKKDELVGQKQQLQQSLEKEQKHYRRNAEAQYVYSNYAAKIGMEQENLSGFVEVLDEQIEQVSELIAEAYQELKKFDILLETKQREEVEEEKLKERLTLDEMTTVRYVYNKKQEGE